MIANEAPGLANSATTPAVMARICSSALRTPGAVVKIASEAWASTMA
jgi:hypothetical protein